MQKSLQIFSIYEKIPRVIYIFHKLDQPYWSSLIVSRKVPLVYEWLSVLSMSSTPYNVFNNNFTMANIRN